jgi:drug/metabolite transporter (DMT)-like permease
MSRVLKNHLQLHFVVFIYGFTAIIGKLVVLPAVEMVWYRTLIAFLSLGVYILVRKIPVSCSPTTIAKLIGIGVVVAFHWITFFHAIKISNASVALGCLASTTLFTSILEPIILRRRVVRLEVIIGLLIIAGLYLIFQFEVRYKMGIVTALTSAFLAGLFTVLNKVFIEKHHPVCMSFYEMVSGFICITFFMLLVGSFKAGIPLPSFSDSLWLLALGVVCTAYAFVVAIKVMKVLSAFTVVLSINMEPVYGIIMAFFIFRGSEFMSGGFYVGTVIILSSVFLYPIVSRKGRNALQ